MSKYLSTRFADLEAYVPGEQPQDMQYITLNTNESPFPPAPAVLEAVNGLEISRLNLYPDPEGKALRETLAKHYGVEAGNIFLANGSDELLNFFFSSQKAMKKKFSSSSEPLARKIFSSFTP